MRRCHRQGDSNSGGGIITTIPQFTVFANFRPVAVNFSLGASHSSCPKPPIHCAGAWVTLAIAPNVFIGGVPVIREGDVDSCGHVRVAGSPNVFVN